MLNNQVVVVTGFALALDGAVGWIEAKLMVWRPSGGETEKL